MRTFAAAILLALASTMTYADEGSCIARAAEKKLAGAAKASFMTKCEKDAQARCETAAAEKKLAGAARNSFLKKCPRDAVGQ